MDSAPESLDSDDSYDQVELQLKKQRAKEKSIATLARKYQGIRKAVDDDVGKKRRSCFSTELFQRRAFAPNPKIDRLKIASDVFCRWRDAVDFLTSLGKNVGKQVTRIFIIQFKRK